MTDRSAREVMAAQIAHASMSYDMSETASVATDKLLDALRAEGWRVAKLEPTESWWGARLFRIVEEA